MNDSTHNSNSVAPSWPRKVGYLPLIAGLIIGLWALMGPLGVWFGWWEFGKGFQLLGQVNGYARWVAGGCAVVGVIVIALSIKFSSGAVVRTGIFTVIGVVMALGAYYVPQSYAPPEGTPPIHDVSTDTINPIEYVDVLPLRADAPNTVVYGGSPNMTPERLAELQTEAFPDLIPVRFTQSQEEVFANALAAVETLGWELVSQVPAEGRIEATDTTFWFRFKDDVVIKIHTDGSETVVNARSLSRVGGGDAGANANRLRKFFALLGS